MQWIKAFGTDKDDDQTLFNEMNGAIDELYEAGIEPTPENIATIMRFNGTDVEAEQNNSNHSTIRRA